MATHRPDYTFLLAYDGSKHSHAAVDILCELAGSSASTKNLSVHVLTVFTPRQIKVHHVLNTHLQQTKRYLENNLCVDISADLMLGYPSEKILEFAENLNPDLILLGAKGLRATLGILLGGVAQQVVEYACCPVLVARAPHQKLGHILLAVDSSAYGKEVVQYLNKLYLPSNVKITALHVLPPLPSETLPAYASEIWPISADQIPIPTIKSEQIAEELTWLEEEEKQGSALLDSTVKGLMKPGRVPERVLLRGDAATEILNFSNNNKVDLIVAGSRGLSQLRGFFVGSVSRKLVHYAHCSVLIVKSLSQSGI